MHAVRSRGRLDATFCALLHQAEVLRAAQWQDYLVACRDANHDMEREQAAWDLLQERLQAIDDQLAERVYPHEG